ncbi:hypothetical protein TIFTF001_052519, partial [Ficus carica]
MGTATRCLNRDTNLGIEDRDPSLPANKNLGIVVDATNGGGNPFDNSIVNAMENSDKFK